MTGTEKTERTEMDRIGPDVGDEKTEVSIRHRFSVPSSVLSPGRIGGPLDYSKLKSPAQPAASAESGAKIPVQEPRPTASAINQFQQLDQQGQAAAIRSLAASGYSDHEIARITGLHVEMVRRLLAVQTDQAGQLHAARWQEGRDA